MTDTSPANDLQRMGLKIYADRAEGLGTDRLLPVFHQWIQRGAVDGLLIDVAVYDHLPEGPALLLVAHEGNYAVDHDEGGVGLLYQRKQPMDGSLAERIRSLAATALRAAAVLEAESAVTPAAVFAGHRLRFFANDRLLAPNTEATWSAVSPALHAVLGDLFGDTPFETRHAAAPKERFSVDISAGRPMRVRALLERLESAVTA